MTGEGDDGMTPDDWERLNAEREQAPVLDVQQPEPSPQPTIQLATRDGVPTNIDPARPVKATAFKWVDPLDIPPRKWLYGRHLIRKFVSMDVAPGATGKSSLKIGEAIQMTSGVQIYKHMVYDGPLAVWLYNLEDPLEEIQRRIAAVALYFKIDPALFEGRLFVDSGRDQPCVIGEETRNGAVIMRPVVESIVAEIKERRIDVLIIDPFVSSHAMSENDNRAMDMVAKEWGKIADRCDCSINLVHHIRKSNGEEANADSARGAKAVVDAARSVLVYNRMTVNEASEAQIPPEQAKFYFRTNNDKANLAPVEGSDWYRMNNIDLPNGDAVGVACQWQWPDLFEGISAFKLREVQAAIDAGSYRASNQAADWGGYAVASVLGLNVDTETDGKNPVRSRVTKMIAEWVKNGALIIVPDKVENQRKAKPFLKVGTWVQP